MNCLYITLFYNIVAGIVHTFVKSWKELSVSQSHRSLPPALWTTSWFLLAPHHRCRTSFGEFTAPLRHILPIHNVTINSKNLFVNFRWTVTFCVEKSYDGWTSHLAGLWIGAAISNTFHQKNEHGSQVKDQGRRQCCQNKHKKFPYRPTRDVSLLSRHTSYFCRVLLTFWLLTG
jgi:hypothetical protein